MNQHRDEDQLCAGEKDAFSGFIFTTAYVVFITAKSTLIFIHTIHKLAWKPTYTWFQNKTSCIVLVEKFAIHFFYFRSGSFYLKNTAWPEDQLSTKRTGVSSQFFSIFGRWIPTTFDNNLPDRLKLFKERLLSLCYSQSSLSRSISVAFVT